MVDFLATLRAQAKLQSTSLEEARMEALMRELVAKEEASAARVP